MVTTTQLQNLLVITDILRNKEMSIADLQKEVGIKRSTLIYYLNILESKGFIEKERIQKKKTGRPVIIKFNLEKYKEAQEKWEKDFQEREQELLNHPLTFEVLKLLKQNPKLEDKELDRKTTNYFGKAWHLSWLIGKGLIVNEFKITPEGEKFLKENKEVKK